MFDLEFLQVLNDWQLGGNPRQKKQRALRLKEATLRVDPGFRSVALCCFRQISLDKSSLWKLGDTLHLAETISSWTVSLEVAGEFKGGVPPQGWQGIIFLVAPRPEEVVLNLASLYADPSFRSACERSRNQIRNYHAGIGRYAGSQHEVVLDIPSLPLSAVYALGGYSSSREVIRHQFFGREPSSIDSSSFDLLFARSGRTLGPHWLRGEGKDRVISSMLAHVERLRPRYPRENSIGSSAPLGGSPQPAV